MSWSLSHHNISLFSSRSLSTALLSPISYFSVSSSSPPSVRAHYPSSPLWRTRLWIFSVPSSLLQPVGLLAGKTLKSIRRWASFGVGRAGGRAGIKDKKLKHIGIMDAIYSSLARPFLINLKFLISLKNFRASRAWRLLALSYLQRWWPRFQSS